MAKPARKTKQQTASAYEVAIAACVSTFASIIGSMQSALAEALAASTSRSQSATLAIGALSDALPDPSDFAKAIVEVFGNGERGKGNVKGKLADTLDAKAPVTIRAFLSQCRTVAQSWRNPAVKEASAKGIRAAYDVAKPPKAKPEAKDSAVVASPIKPEEVVAMLVRERGPSAVMAMIESACNALARTLEANVVHEARAKLAAK